MSNRELPMMPWYPDQFASATSTWNFAERAAYRALLDVQWAIGTLPRDLWRLARAIGMELPDFEAVWPVVKDKFQEIDGGLRNFRLEQHRLTAVRRKQGQRSAAETTNAKRYGERDGDRGAQRVGNRGKSDTVSESVSASPPSPSPSPTVREEHPLPPQGGGNGLTANGGHRGSLKTWRTVAPITESVRGTSLTWDSVREKLTDPVAIAAITAVGDGDFEQGCRTIADRDRFSTKRVESKFREAYERLSEHPSA